MKQANNKGKEPKMEKFYIPGSLENVLSWGDRPILYPLEVVVDSYTISYNCQRKYIVKITQKRRRVDVESVVICITEEPIMDIKRDKIN
jgi:hypothetical protein